MIPINFNTQYLNKTVNKDSRRAALIHSLHWGYLGTLWHETGSPDPSNPYGTLDYNLNAYDSRGRPIKSSYDYLIARDGTIFQYIDSKAFTSWHSGVSSWTAPGGGVYRNYAANEVLLSVELDGKNDGTPVTAQQLQSAGRLAIYLRDEFGIPLDRRYHPEHREVAPGRKTDPRGYTPDQVLAAAATLLAQAKPAPVEIPAMTYYRVTATAGLWIRTAPNTDGRKVRLMRPDEVVGVVEVVPGENIDGNSQWAHIGDYTGFASMRWMEKA